jgi:ribonuclease HII
VLCGIDEVGRGPWAGPIVASAVILVEEIRFKGLKDSKKLTAKARAEACKILQQKAFFGIGKVESKEVDKLGLIKATNAAFIRALEDMCKKKGCPKPDFLLVDGRDRLKLPYPHKTIIKGDEKLKLIACASIIAKVTRDNIMDEFAAKFPDYGFDEHKGYGTARHQQALKSHGACEIHRKSFKPVHKLYQGTLFN